MLEVIVDPKLEEINGEKQSPDFGEKSHGYASLIDHIESLHGAEKRGNWKIYENLIPKDTTWYHDNLVFYVQQCWACHAGIVFRPDMLYFAVYSEIAQYVVKNADECRAIFTDKPEKQKIIIVQDVTKCIEFNRVIAELKARIPTSIENLLPEFTTDTEMSREARWAAFAEAASPYYEYFTTRCGIKKVRLEGSEQDWASIEKALKEWENLLPGKEIKAYLGKTVEICQTILAQVRKGQLNPEFWSKIFWDANCGSGHPQFCGWLIDLCNRKQRCSSYDVRGQITSVEWHVIGAGGGLEEHFIVHHGLFASKLDKKNYLVPEFSRIIFVEKEK